MKTQRDAFFDALFDIAKEDEAIVLLSADMGAPSLDRWREELPAQFVNTGIAEQNMINVAAGLALSGKKPFCYAIMPFVTSRCYEAIKLNVCAMNLPITLVGVGAGFSYDDSGPTHHSIDDISIMRVLPNMTICNASDSTMARAFATIAYNCPGPIYVRLDRETLPQIYEESTVFEGGKSVLRGGYPLLIIATGNMVHKALAVKDVSVWDMWRLKPLGELYLHGIEQIITLEEHLLAGGLGSAIAEALVDSELSLPLKRIGVKDQFYYTYGGRKHIQEVAGLRIQYLLILTTG